MRKALVAEGSDNEWRTREGRRVSPSMTHRRSGGGSAGRAPASSAALALAEPRIGFVLETVPHARRAAATPWVPTHRDDRDGAGGGKTALRCHPVAMGGRTGDGT